MVVTELNAGSALSRLETPAPLVDLDRMERNITRMARYARQHGIALRPHIKTHKSKVVAAQQMSAGAVGLTCATPAEAVVMSAVCHDLLLAYPPVGAKAERLLSVPPSARVTVSLDSARAIDDLAIVARRSNREIGVYVEVDVGMHRVGVPTVDEAIALARHVRASAPLQFAGVAFYPGHIRSTVASQDGELATLTADIGRMLVAFDRAGLPPAIVSGGSTPTMWRTHEMVGVTEMRPGTYVYNDRTTAEIGACSWDDCAFSVLATVVSTAVPGQAVIDAGAKALGREPMRGASGEGFGALLDRPDVVVARMSEEHGILDLSRTDWRPSVGDLVRVVPNHVCIVVHLNDLMYGVRGDRVDTSWPVDARGRSHPVVTA
ncbi:D-TA family PLP-dependent enzyme [bacterium]|nr:D-TA family PLP-dependent enzyme [bacterium]